MVLPGQVKAVSPFASMLQSTYSDLSSVDLELPDRLLVGLGYAATSPDSPLDFRQAQSAAERSGVAGPHCWSLMLPTSARVAQEVYEPLIGIQYPMLCSRLGDTWQIGATSIREDQLIASGLRFVHWCHASANVDARKDPKNSPTVQVYQHLEDELIRADAGNEGILALTTTREGTQNLRNYFDVAGKKANAETAVKVAGATARHCIIMHGESTFLSGEGRNLDYDQECFTRANVAYSRATNLTILACPLNMQGMPGALQVLAALLHGVQTIYTYDDREPTIRGSLDLTPTQVKQATATFQQALSPPELWVGPVPVCLAEYHEGKVRRLRLVLATHSHLTKAEISSLQDGPHLPGCTAAHGLVYGCALDASPTPEWLVIPDGQQAGRWRLLHNSNGPGQRCSVGCSQRYQPTPNTAEHRKAQDYTFEALHRVYFYDAWRPQPVLDFPGSELVLPPKPGLLVQGCYSPQPSAPEDVLSVSDAETEAADQPCQSPASPETPDATMADEEASKLVSVLSSPSEPSTLPSSVLPEGADSPMEEEDGDATSSGDEGDCLSNCPASSKMRPANEAIKRRPGARAGRGKAQSKKAQTVGGASIQTAAWQHS